MTVLRTYISRIDSVGRLVIFRSDGAPVSEEERDWFNKTITVQLRTDHMIKSHGYEQDGALLESDVVIGKSRKTGEEIRVHPLILQLKTLLKARGWRLSDTSKAIGMRDTALSEWMRGTMRPTLANIAAAFGATGYRLVPVPIQEEATVRIYIDAAEKEILHDLFGMESD